MLTARGSGRWAWVEKKGDNHLVASCKLQFLGGMPRFVWGLMRTPKGGRAVQVTTHGSSLRHAHTTHLPLVGETPFGTGLSVGPMAPTSKMPRAITSDDRCGMMMNAKGNDLNQHDPGRIGEPA